MPFSLEQGPRRPAWHHAAENGRWSEAFGLATVCGRWRRRAPSVGSKHDVPNTIHHRTYFGRRCGAGECNTVGIVKTCANDAHIKYSVLYSNRPPTPGGSGGVWARPICLAVLVFSAGNPTSFYRRAVLL